MKALRLLGIAILASFLTLSVLGESLSAEKYPTKPIQIIIGFVSGDTDNGLRPYI